MRDPKRITELLDLLEVYWQRNPDLRLGQIISNLAFMEGQEPFYIEDDRTIELLRVLTNSG